MVGNAEIKTKGISEIAAKFGRRIELN